MDDLDIFSKKTKKILKAIKKGNEDDDEIKEAIDYFALKPEKRGEKPEREVKSCYTEIKKERIKNKLRKTQKEIKRAEKNKDKEKLKELTQRAYKLSKKLQENSHD